MSELTHIDAEGEARMVDVSAKPEQAVTSAKCLVAAGAEGVKAEGGQAILPQVEAIVAAGIPFLGHLGMLPQSVVEGGGYRIKGRDDEQREALLADSQALGQAGAFGIVLELVTPTVAAEITGLVLSLIHI